MASRVLNAESRFPSRVQIKTRTNRQPILPLNLSLVLCRISQPAGRVLMAAGRGCHGFTIHYCRIHWCSSIR